MGSTCFELIFIRVSAAGCLGESVLELGYTHTYTHTHTYTCTRELQVAATKTLIEFSLISLAVITFFIFGRHKS